MFFSSFGLLAQKELVIEKGTASYVSSQNTYVKFSSTANIESLDTLFSLINESYIPALIVKYKSSTSCVCSNLLTEKVKIGDVFYAKTFVIIYKDITEESKVKRKTIVETDSINIHTVPIVKIPSEEIKEEPEFKQKIKGRISAGSYSTFFDGEESHRMRYTFSFQGNNIKNSKFSTDNYISFRHTIGDWQQVREHFSDALKVYSLALKYDLNKTTQISFGRKINYRISSMGAIDGLQLEKSFGNFQVGLMGGSRPDYSDYSFNIKLLQGGIYLNYSTKKKEKSQESTIAFVDQLNNSKTDRRYVYFQHINTLIKNLAIFTSFEVDLYQNINNVESNNLSLTNFLINLRYKISKKWDISLAYDNRKNVIYYESYKNYIDQLIENETRQGFRFGMNYRFSKLLTAGSNLTWHFQKGTETTSKNLNAYVNFSSIPIINATASLSANILQTAYLDSKVYGIQLTKDIFRNKLSSDIYFRMVEYNYSSFESNIKQNIAGINLSWNISRKLSFYIYYEGTFDNQNKTFNNLNTKIVQRF